METGLSADEKVYKSKKMHNIQFKKKTVFDMALGWEINVVYFWVINVNRF
jgi:hypothetical protein